jgi:predicted transcriptional regulator
VLAGEHDGLPARELAERCELSLAYVGRVLAKLVRSGQVDNVRSGRTVRYRAVAA